MTIDWRDSARSDVLHFVMVDPNNLETTYGDLGSVQLSGSSLSFGYYTDTRASGKIQFLQDNYVENAWIRVVHEVPAAGYSRELGTFILTNPSQTISGEAINETRDMQSVLWALKEDRCPGHFAIGTKASALAAFQRICEITGRDYLIQGANDFVYPKAVVYEIGDSYLDMLFDIAEASGNRMDVDGHGRIVLRPLPTGPATPVWTLDTEDPRSMIQEGSISMESSLDDLSSRAIVSCSNGGVEASGYADLDDNGKYSAHRRGYTKATLYSVNSLSPNTNAAAAALARQYLDNDSMIITWKINALYFPCNCGEYCNLIIDGVKRITMIQSVDPIDLNAMTMSLTLKEVLNNG